jgi:glutaryl-CoA dehydrogenase
MNAPPPFDFYKTRSLLDTDEQEVQLSVGRFVDEQVVPIIGACFEEERFPLELVPQMAELGLFGCNIEGYGGAGMNEVSYGLVCQELERGDSGLRSFVSVQNSLCMYPILRYGSEEQRERYLPGMAAGEILGSFGLTEPDGGSDPGTMKTHAARDGDTWVLNGAKMWITNGTIADISIVWARTDEGVAGFIVEKDLRGFGARDIPRKMSLRASVTSELFFDDVRVPERNRLPLATGLVARSPA